MYFRIQTGSITLSGQSSCSFYPLQLKFDGVYRSAVWLVDISESFLCNLLSQIFIGCFSRFIQKDLNSFVSPSVHLSVHLSCFSSIGLSVYAACKVVPRNTLVKRQPGLTWQSYGTLICTVKIPCYSGCSWHTFFTGSVPSLHSEVTVTVILNLIWISNAGKLVWLYLTETRYPICMFVSSPYIVHTVY